MKAVMWFVGAIMLTWLLVSLFSAFQNHFDRREVGKIIEVSEIYNKEILLVHFKNIDICLRNEKTENFVLPFGEIYSIVKDKSNGGFFLVWGRDYDKGYYQIVPNPEGE